MVRNRKNTGNQDMIGLKDKEGRSHSGSSHNHSHGKGHSAQPDHLNRAFTVAIIMNLVFVAVEFGAGLIIDSMALISDAGHNLSDVVSLALALLAFRLSKLKPNDRYTYGRKKSTIVVSLINAIILLFVIGFILYESIHKIFQPQPVEGGIIAWVAGVGIVINGFTAWLFLRDRKKDLNINGAFLHMVADALVSVGVVISGILITLTGWYILDPIIGIVIAIVIFISTWGLLRDSIRLSLDGVPRNLCLNDIARDIVASDSRIKGIHHIHIWPMSTTENALTAHIVMETLDGSGEIIKKIKKLLSEKGIAHVTLEAELAGKNECGGDCYCE